jgi:hypothetical protein
MKPHTLAAAVVQSDTTVQVDDFKLIHGIGTGLEARLHAAGIRTFARLAAMTPETIASALGHVTGLTVKRIVEQDWIGQARDLTPIKHPGNLDPDAEAERQHYATFTVELLLGEDNAVRRTRAVFIQAEKEDAWAGWDEKRLLGFLAQQAGLQTSAPTSKSAPTPVEEPAQQPLKISGNPRLKPARITGRAAHEGHILGKDEPFEITLPFDLADVTLPGYSEIDFKLNLNAKALGGGSHLQLGEAQGRFEPSKENEVTLKCPGLNEGVYRIRVDLALNPPMMERGSRAVQMATLDGGLLQIY